MPASIARAGIPDIGQSQAPPFRQPAAALAAELPRQHGLFTIFVGADDVRAQLATAAMVEAGHLPFAEDGVVKYSVSSAGHGAARFDPDQDGTTITPARAFGLFLLCSREYARLIRQNIS
jgi:hypothetical protein